MLVKLLAVIPVALSLVQATPPKQDDRFDLGGYAADWGYDTSWDSGAGDALERAPRDNTPPDASEPPEDLGGEWYGDFQPYPNDFQPYDYHWAQPERSK